MMAGGLRGARALRGCGAWLARALVVTACGAALLPVGPHRGLAASAINLFDGVYRYSYTDIQIAGSGPGIQFTRAYASHLAAEGVGPQTLPLGPGWTHNYNLWLSAQSPGSRDAMVLGPQGSTYRYTYQVDGTYAPAPGVDSSLERRADGTFAVTHPSGLTWVFNRQGRLTRVAGATGAGSDLGYNARGQLVSIGDPDGRGVVSLAYDDRGMLVSISDWLAPPRTVRFGYDAVGRLETVTNRAGHTTKYRYDSVEPVRRHLLTEIVDARGHTAIALTYDDQRRAVTRYDARGLTSGHATRITYDTLPDGRRHTVSTYPPSAFAPEWPFLLEDIHDSHGNLLERIGRPTPDEAYAQRYRYDSRFNLVAVTTDDGRALPRVLPRDYTFQSCRVNDVLEDDETDWAEAAAVLIAALTHMSPPGVGSAMGGASWALALAGIDAERGRGVGSGDSPLEFDAVGRLTAVRFNGPRAANGVGLAPGEGLDATDSVLGPIEPLRAQRYDYDDEDRVVRLTEERADGPARVTDYHYDAAGNLMAVVRDDGAAMEMSYDERDGLVLVRWGLVGGASVAGPAVGTDAVRYAYDERGDVVRTVRESGGTVVARLEYEYDGLHRLRRVAAEVAGQAQSGELSAHGQHSAGVAGRSVGVRFEYDRDGNCAGHAAE